VTGRQEGRARPDTVQVGASAAGSADSPPTSTPAEAEVYLTPAMVAMMVPGLTTGNLAQLRYEGRGPKFLKPTPRTVVYRRRDVIVWLNEHERTTTRN